MLTITHRSGIPEDLTGKLELGTGWVRVEPEKLNQGIGGETKQRGGWEAV